MTISKQDSSLRVWNYITLKCEIAKESDPLTRAPNCLALHPSGYYFALGFIDKIRLFHLMLHEIRAFRELTVKNTSILKFSREGNLLAAV